jgi:hypothetical protein
MHMHDALAQGPLDEEAETHVFCAPLVRVLGTTNMSALGPFGPRVVAVGGDFCTRAEQFLAAGVGAD